MIRIGEYSDGEGISYVIFRSSDYIEQLNPKLSCCKNLKSITKIDYIHRAIIVTTLYYTLFMRRSSPWNFRMNINDRELIKHWAAHWKRFLGEWLLYIGHTSNQGLLTRQILNLRRVFFTLFTEDLMLKWKNTRFNFLQTVISAIVSSVIIPIGLTLVIQLDLLIHFVLSLVV